MKTVFVRPLALVLPVLTAGLLLAGCPKSDSSSDVPYGQQAPSTGAPSPMTAPSTGAVAPPGPKMGGQPPVAGGSGSGAPMGGGPMSGGPMAGGPMMGGDPMAPLTPTPELDKAIKDAEAKKDKKAIGAAYASRGFSRMMDDKAGQRIKYRAALEDFRASLKNDPTNAKAKENKEQIESIYKSMGRPIPGEEGK